MHLSQQFAYKCSTHLDVVFLVVDSCIATNIRKIGLNIYFMVLMIFVLPSKKIENLKNIISSYSLLSRNNTFT